MQNFTQKEIQRVELFTNIAKLQNFLHSMGYLIVDLTKCRFRGIHNNEKYNIDVIFGAEDGVYLRPYTYLCEERTPETIQISYSELDSKSWEEKVVVHKLISLEHKLRALIDLSKLR